MGIEDFLKEKVEGYLFKDLESISKISVPIDEVGNGTFPMLATILIGIELFGTLMSPKNAVETVSGKLRLDGDKHFNHFWIQYLSYQFKQYSNFHNLFRVLLRNGLAHTFMVKHSVLVYKNNPNHMRCDKNHPVLIIGCEEFFQHLRHVYTDQLLPVAKGKTNSVTGIDKSKMEKNLSDLLSFYEMESKAQFANLNISKKLNTQWINTGISSAPSMSTVKSEDIKEITDYVTPSGIFPDDRYR